MSLTMDGMPGKMYTLCMTAIGVQPEDGSSLHPTGKIAMRLVPSVIFASGYFSFANVIIASSVGSCSSTPTPNAFAYKGTNDTSQSATPPNIPSSTKPQPYDALVGDVVVGGADASRREHVAAGPHKLRQLLHGRDDGVLLVGDNHHALEVDAATEHELGDEVRVGVERLQVTDQRCQVHELRGEGDRVHAPSP
ncbi:unnamed protein product [Phytophthora lilii]|uniref:Unnamed protein product n=1 Tax=Phytophthora lilii TaxID=2077276 RepID=A0A9W6U869_9STRA|nr:unnamed protein product [Phytophthora lilii]